MNRKIAYYLDRRIFRHGEQIFINKVEVQKDTRLHAHDFIEIAYVSAGNGIHRINENEYLVSKGDIFIINYDVPHEFLPSRNLSDVELVVYNCIFTPEFLDCSLVNCKDFSNVAHHFLFRAFFPEEDKSAADIKLIDCDIRTIQDIYERMYREYNNREDGYIEILRAYVIELLITIFRAVQKSRSLNERVEVRRKQIIDKVILYIKSNYARELKLEELSMLAFLSPGYFCRCFKEYTGMTVSEYTQKIRIDEACRLLKETSGKVIDIAADVGYRDIKYFNQVFKRITGKTPGEYRKSRRFL